MSVSGPPAAIKTEPEEGPSDVFDYDAARIKSELALLYVDHEIKEEMVVGPTEICHPLPGAGVSPREGGAPQQAVASKCTDYEYRRMAGCRLELRDVARELLCARCGQWSLTAEQVRQHQQRACLGKKRCRLVLRDVARELLCARCGQWSLTAEQVRQHQQRACLGNKRSRLVLRDVADELLCARCGQWSLSRAALHTHRRTHHTMATAQAEQIPTPVLPLKGKLPQHMGTDQHPVSSAAGNLQGPTLADQRDNTSTPATLTHQLFICDLCRKRFTDRSLLAKHIHSHTNLHWPRDTKLVLKQDLRSSLSQNVIIHSETEPLSCDQCGRIFTRKYTLSRHVLTHSEMKRFSCDKCGKKFAQKSVLSQHVLIHAEIKPFFCGKCGKSFALKCYLSKHLLIHSGIKSFFCEKCQKSFTRKHDLTRHEHIHSGIKPFSCDTCHIRFATKSSLSQHNMRIHGMTMTNPFSCTKCGKIFCQKSKLSQHVLTHSGIKPFSCDKCGKSFDQKCTLSRHMIVHSKARPFSCHKCGKSFGLKSHLARHNLVHSGKP